MMKERLYVVSGGSSGIGQAIALRLAQNPAARVISVSRSREKIKRAQRENPDLEKQVDFFPGDVSDEKDCLRLMDYIESRYGMLHGLVNNAGILTKGGMEMVSYQQWKNNLEVNLNGPYLLTKTLLPLMKKAESAAIVNISSIASMKPGSSVAYSVSKAGLDMLTEFLAGDLGPYNIRVNSINPGLVTTNIHLDNKIVADQDQYQKMLDKALPRYPVGRIGKPEDIAELAEFLLSDKASWITGSIIRIDGGASVYNDLIPPKEV